MTDEVEKAVSDVSHLLEFRFGPNIMGWPVNPMKYFGDPAREAVRVGRASRDAEVAELKRQVLGAYEYAARLREQLTVAANQMQTLAEQQHELERNVELAEAELEVEETRNADYRTRNDDLARRVSGLETTIAKVRSYAADRDFHARGHLNTVNSGRIASDLYAIVGRIGAEQ